MLPSQITSRLPTAPLEAVGRMSHVVYFAVRVCEGQEIYFQLIFPEVSVRSGGTLKGKQWERREMKETMRAKWQPVLKILLKVLLIKHQKS